MSQAMHVAAAQIHQSFAHNLVKLLIITDTFVDPGIALICQKCCLYRLLLFVLLNTTIHDQLLVLLTLGRAFLSS